MKPFGIGASEDEIR